jgi:type II secretion system protein H
MRKNDPSRRAGAFTLVELILVMTLLAIVMAIAAPSLSGSMRQRHLADEATRFVALTEYARDEAISQGVPMVVWFDPATARCGVEAKAGYPGEEQRAKEFTLNPDVHFEVASAASNGLIEAVEYAPTGILQTASAASVRLVDRFASEMTVVRTTDGLGYEIVKESR